MKTQIVIFPGGSARQQIDLRTWDFPDIQAAALLPSDRNLATSLAQLYRSMTTLLAAIRRGSDLPPECFVPDLWHYRDLFPKGEAEEIWDAVGKALCIAENYYETRLPNTQQNRIMGNLFTDPVSEET